MAAEVDEVLQRVGALLGITEDGDAGAGRTWVMPVNRLRSITSPPAASSRTRRLASEVAKRSLTKAFCASLVGDQPVGEVPRLLLGLAADDLQAHAEADLVWRPCAAAMVLISAMLARMRS